MPFARPKSTVAQAVLPVLAGLVFFALVGLAAWGIAAWTLTVRNGGGAAYRDLLFRCRYTDAEGRVVRESGGTLAEVLQPGQRRSLQVVDGRLDPAAAEGRLLIVGGEKVLPLSALAQTPQP